MRRLHNTLRTMRLRGDIVLLDGRSEEGTNLYTLPEAMKVANPMPKVATPTEDRDRLKARVFATLRNGPQEGLTTAQVVEALGLPLGEKYRNPVHSLMWRLRRAGKIVAVKDEQGNYLHKLVGGTEAEDQKAASVAPVVGGPGAQLGTTYLVTRSGDVRPVVCSTMEEALDKVRQLGLAGVRLWMEVPYKVDLQVPAWAQPAKK
jgi:hypothetical protein